ncbi:MAG: DUF2059 domain-containing protein [Deltaproteobacteria bacterium]|jgi:hypothetical protein|nr:DUF2059 domain-containing protein [Deltaproteobacteria bacterium]MBW2496102.1 DUF2059 domain-containing protein [Deltaproteobacteria bacterium]
MPKPLCQAVFRVSLIPLVTFVVLATGAAIFVAGPIASASEKESAAQHLDRARHLMEISGSTEMGMQMADLLSAQLFAAMQQSDPTLPEAVHDVISRVASDLVKERSGALFAEIAPIYVRHFSSAEIDAMIRFYESPTGQKVVKVMPDLMQESVVISQSWAIGLQPELLSRLEQELGPLGLE